MTVGAFVFGVLAGRNRNAVVGCLAFAGMCTVGGLGYLALETLP